MRLLFGFGFRFRRGGLGRFPCQHGQGSLDVVIPARCLTGAGLGRAHIIGQAVGGPEQFLDHLGAGLELAAADQIQHRLEHMGE